MTGSTPYKAVFRTFADAKAFAAVITEPGWCTTNVAHSARTVTWDVPHEAATTRSYFADMLEAVDHFGGPRATLNGVPAWMAAKGWGQ